MATLDPSIASGYTDVRSDSSDTNWVIFGYDLQKKNLIRQEAAGSAWNEFVSHFQDDQSQYGFARLNIDERRVKFIFVTWVGTKTKFLQRAKVSIHKSVLKDVIRDFSIEVHVDMKEQLEHGLLLSRLRKVSGAGEEATHSDSLNVPAIRTPTKQSKVSNYKAKKVGLNDETVKHLDSIVHDKDDSRTSRPNVDREETTSPLFINLSQISRPVDFRLTQTRFPPVRNLKRHIHNEIPYDEWEQLQMYDNETKFVTTYSEKEENSKKNRYLNHCTIDQSRVTLPVPDEDGSDYLNANFVSLLDVDDPSVHEPQDNSDLAGYILCQAPPPATIPAFWSVLWHQKVPFVVMLTDLEEGTEIKADLYWATAEEPHVVYGDYTIEYVGEQSVMEGRLTVTELKISRSVAKDEDGVAQETREFKHLQYHGWPDHGLPTDTRAFVNLISLCNQYLADFRVASKTAPPRENQLFIPVHCSAGLGRSAIFVLVHSQLVLLARRQRLNKPILFNVPEILRHMRSQRRGLFQRVEQYLFAYQLISELSQTDLGIDISKNDDEEAWTPRSSSVEEDSDEEGGEQQKAVKELSFEQLVAREEAKLKKQEPVEEDEEELLD